VGGESKEKTYGKSGKFSVKRYLEGKKYFYYRSGKIEGDQELEKKMEKDYDCFLNAREDEEINRILEANPKLIYAIKLDILELLIQQENLRTLKALRQSPELAKKLPNYLQKAFL
jgi:hypothetical protein